MGNNKVTLQEQEIPPVPAGFELADEDHWKGFPKAPDIIQENKNLNFVQRILDPNRQSIKNPDGTISTHKMATEVDESGNWFVFPTIVEKDGQLIDLKDNYKAFEYAKKTGELIGFGKNKEKALSFGSGGYKKGAEFSDEGPPVPKGFEIDESYVGPTVSAAKKPGPFFRDEPTMTPGLTRKVERDPTRAEWMDFYDFNKDVPDLGFKVRAAASTGTIDDVQNQIAIELGVNKKDVEIAEAEGVGFVYSHPEMEGYAPVDPVGLDVEDITTVGLELAPAIGGAVSGIGTAALTKSPVAATLAASGTAGTIKAVQLSIMKQLGIIDPPTQEIITEALIEGGMELAGGLAPGIGRGIRRVLPTKGSARQRVSEKLAEEIDPEDLAKARAEADRIADAVEAETGVRPEFTTGQQMALIEPERAAKIQALERTASDVTEITRSQRLAEEALQKKVEPTVGKEFLEEEAAAGVKQVAEPRWAAAEQSIENTAQKTLQKLELRRGALPQTEAAEAGESIRVALQEGNDAAYAPLRKAYNTFDEEFAEIPVDMKTMKNAAKELEKDKTIFPEWATDSRAAIRQAKKTKGTATFTDVQTALSDIRSKLRVMRKEGASVPEMKKVEAIKDSLKESRDAALQKVSPERADEMLALEEAYSKYKRVTSEGVIGSVMRQSQRGYVVADTNILNNMIRNADDVRSIKQIAVDHPDLNILPQMREALMVKYRNSVIDGAGTHKKFLETHKTAIDELLSPKERAMMVNASRAKSAIPLALKREKALIKDLQKTMPEYKLSQFQSTEVMSRMQGDVATANKVKNVLSRHPEKWKVVQEARKKQISDKSQTLSGLETILKNERSEISVTLGKDYIKTLETALSLAKAKAKGAVVGGKEIVGRTDLDLARALVFGPLSRVGFVKTVAGAVGEAKAKRVTAELIQDSKMLEKVIRAQLIKNERRQALAIMSATGVGIMRADNDIEAPKYKGEK